LGGEAAEVAEPAVPEAAAEPIVEAEGEPKATVPEPEAAPQEPSEAAPEGAAGDVELPLILGDPESTRREQIYRYLEGQASLENPIPPPPGGTYRDVVFPPGSDQLQAVVAGRVFFLSGGTTAWLEAGVATGPDTAQSVRVKRANA
jgi:hypothetical protein